MQQHRHQEFIRFLNTINASVPPDNAVHVILDNYAAHKHAKVRAWLDRHTRFTFHFTPTSCSWLNAVEGFFAKLTKRRLKRGVFQSVIDLQSFINRFVAEHNDKPKPFTWTADPNKIIAAVKRGHQALDSIAPHDDLETVMVWREQRTVTQALTLHYNKALFILDPSEISRPLAGKRVDVCEYPDGGLEIRHGEYALP